MFGIYKEEIETGTRERRNENIYPWQQKINKEKILR
jgi:hypothetical protein